MNRRQNKTPDARAEAEFAAKATAAIEHAAATGRAVVTGADGQARVVISIPTTDLPTLAR